MNTMNEKIRLQFSWLRGLINSNIESIRALLMQAKQLEELANSFSDQGNDPQQKAELQRIIDNIYGTINSLVSQTEDLFRQYTKILQSLDA